MRKLTSLTFALMLAVPMLGATVEETVDRTIDVRPGATLSVDNVNGRISVTSWDQPKVRIVARKQAKGDRSDAAAALRELRIDIESVNGGVTIRTNEPRTRNASGFLEWILGDRVSTQVSYDLTVPRSMSLELENTNGSIGVSDVNGNLDLETTNGRIEVAGCQGSLDASTTNGSIEAALTRVASTIRLETTNGRIDLTVPRGFAADVSASTTNGSINSDLPVATTRFDRNSLRGKINGGGTPLRLNTTNGSITIRAGV